MTMESSILLKTFKLVDLMDSQNSKSITSSQSSRYMRMVQPLCCSARTTSVPCTSYKVERERPCASTKEKQAQQILRQETLMGIFRFGALITAVSTVPRSTGSQQHRSQKIFRHLGDLNKRLLGRKMAQYSSSLESNTRLVVSTIEVKS